MSKAEHRRHGEGTCYKRGNLWQAQVTAEDGSRLSKTFRLEKEGLAWCRQMARQRDEGQLSGEAHRLTVAAFLDRWLTAMAPTLAANTASSYRSIVRTHLLPGLGAHRLAQLRPDHLQVFYAELSRKLGPGTVRGVHALLHNALERAILWGLISRNPADAAKPPHVPKRERQTWDADQARQFLAAVRGDRLEALWVLALSTGLREGELCGLRWEDLTLPPAELPALGVVRVLRQVQRGPKGQGKQVKNLKTDASQGSLLIGEQAISALRAHRVRQQAEEAMAEAEGWRFSGHVFCTADGAPLEPSYIRKAFAKLRSRLRLPYIRPHDLRHTAASLLLRQGVNPQIVQQMLRHTSIKQTLDTYGHLLPTSQAEAALAMERVLQGEK